MATKCARLAPILRSQHPRLLSTSALAVHPARTAATLSLPRHQNPQRDLLLAPLRCRQRRWHTAPPSNSKVYEFDEIQNLSEQPTERRILIDVREPAEYAEGYIPTAINIPVKSAPEALMLSEEEFEDRFGFPKPDTQKEVVFYCRSGVRSSAAAGLAQQAGYENVAEYRGSWLDWAAKGGKVGR